VKKNLTRFNKKAVGVQQTLYIGSEWCHT